MRYFSVLSLFVVGAISLAGCAEKETAAVVVAASNTVCPIMGHEVTDDGGRVEFGGKTVGFCCPGCIEKWEALSDEDKAAKLSSPPGDDHEPGGNHSAPHGEEGHEGRSEAESSEAA